MSRWLMLLPGVVERSPSMSWSKSSLVGRSSRGSFPVMKSKGCLWLAAGKMIFRCSQLFTESQKARYLRTR